MAVENKANFIVNLAGNITQKARAFGADIAAMGDKGSRSMRFFSAATHQTNRVLDTFDNKLVGFATGGGAVMLAKRVGDWQQQMAELSSQFNLTGEQVDRLNQSIWSTAANRKLPYNDIVDAISKMLERTNDADSVTDNLDNIALAIKGIGLNADDAGKKIGVLSSKGYTPEAIHTLLNDAANASKFGTGNISAQFSRVVDMSTATNWKSPEQLRQLLAIERLGDSTFGNSEQSTAAMQSFYSAILEPSKQNILRQNGVEVFNNMKTGELSNPMDIFLEMGNASGFKKRNIDSIVNGDFVELMKSFKPDERQQQLRDAFKSVDNNLIDDKANRNIQTFNSALTSLTNAGEKWAQLKLAKPIQDLADAINSLTPEQLDEYTSKLETGVKIIGGAVAARYLYKGRQMLGGFMSPKTTGGLGGTLSSAAGAADAVPVYVTNWGEQSKNPVSNDQQNKKTGLNTSDIGRGNMDKATGIMSTVIELSNKTWTPEEIEALPDDSPLKKMHKYNQKWEEDPQQFYDEGNSPTWMRYLFNADGDNAIQSAFAKYGEAMMMQSQAYTGFYQPTGEITIKVESDNGLTVKTQSINAKDMGLTVDTGNTYQGVPR